MQTTIPEADSGDSNDVETIVNQLTANTEELTVGYGDRYPEPTVAGLVIEDTNSATGIHHASQDHAIGYDLTAFKSPNETPRDGQQNFLTALRAGDLDPVSDYRRVYRELGRGTTSEYHDVFLHAWVNEAVLFATTVNPLTGMKDGNRNARGNAGYMGIGGATDVVNEIDTVVEAVGHIKEKATGQLFF